MESKIKIKKLRFVWVIFVLTITFLTPFLCLFVVSYVDYFYSSAWWYVPTIISVILVGVIFTILFIASFSWFMDKNSAYNSWVRGQ